MKRMIFPFFIICGFLNAGDDKVIIPLYKSSIAATQHAVVSLDRIDPFTQENFKTLITNSFEQKKRGYSISIYKCLKTSSELEYKIADAEALERWIAQGNRTDPTTQQQIIPGAVQTFILEPGSGTSANGYDVFRVPSATCSINRKRKYEDTQSDEIKKSKIISPYLCNLPVVKTIISPCLRNLPVVKTMTVADLRKGLGLE